MKDVHLLSLILLCLGSGTPCAGNITVVFRFDDYSTRSDEAVETRVIEAFKRSGTRCTVGVIPHVWCGFEPDPRPQEFAPLTEEKAAVLRDAGDQGVLDVAMHGYSHEVTRPGTELVGLNYDEQLERIRRGRAILSELLGTTVTTFVPAWNSYDDATLRILPDLGFQCLSADTWGKLGWERSCPLKFLPSGCDLDGLREAIVEARRIGDSSAIIVVLFHPYDFLENHPVQGRWSFAAFEELLVWTVSQPDVAVKSIGQLLETSADLSARRLADNQRRMRVPAYVPPFLSRRFGVGASRIYLSSEGIRRTENAWRNALVLTQAYTAFLYLAMGCGAALVAFFLDTLGSVRFGRAAVVVSRGVAGVLLLTALGFSLRDNVFGYKCALLVSLSLGVSIGVYRGVFRHLRIKRAIRVLAMLRTGRRDARAS
jgi:peptidoglycan/xylan/chitin deacetylase (PgdA/CDA1 family)